VSPLLLRHVALPLIFVTSALLGGLRFVGAEREFRFVAPPLLALPLAAFLLALLVRSGLLDVTRDWLGEQRPPLENVSNALTLAAVYGATVQVFNAVLPEDTLFNALFTLFFLMVFWNGLFALTRPERFLKSLAGLMLAPFLVKYVVLAALAAPAETTAGTIAKALLRGVTLGALEAESYAPATGYVAFLAVALYMVGLWAASPPRDERADLLFDMLAARRQLTGADERRLLAALASPDAEPDAIDAETED
jgi:hypothetical protein